MNSNDRASKNAKRMKWVVRASSLGNLFVRKDIGEKKGEDEMQMRMKKDKGKGKGGKL